MPITSLRLVLDTNVLLAGLVSKSSASQKVVDSLAARKVIPLDSPHVLEEYRKVLLDPIIIDRFPNLTPRQVESVLHRLKYIGDEYRTTRIRFEFPRDPDDARFIELAIAGRATHLLTMDNDLLSLPTSRTDAGKRFRQRLPNLEVHTPQAFIEHWSAWLEV